MTDIDSNAVNAIGSPWERANEERLFDCPSCEQPFEAPGNVLTAWCPHCGAYGLLLRGEEEPT